MANLRTTRTRNFPTNVNPLNIPNPLVILFHQVEALYFTVGQMLNTVSTENPTVNPTITGITSWPSMSNFAGGPITASNVVTRRTGRPARTLTPAARRKIAAYQKKRWAGIKRGRTTTTRKVTKMPPARVAA